MSKIWFSSDLHFGHANIIKYCNRPFEDVREMDRQLINNWNAKVGPNDLVYIIGDVFFCEASEAKQIMHRLHGMKRLVYGNHDKMIRNQVPVQQLFDAVLPELYHHYIDGTRVVMCHYPLLTWDKAHHGSYMLHGHVHSTVPANDTHRRYDVGVDANDYAPVSWEHIKRTLDKIEKAEPSDVRASRNASKT